MLIIAIPKSASTSLVQTVANLHQIRGVQQFEYKLFPFPRGYEVLCHYHSDMREYDSNQIQQWCSSREVVFKQHIPPTSNNRQLLKNFPKVILLRDVNEILLSYRRNSLKFHGNQAPTYQHLLSRAINISKAINDDTGYFDLFRNNIGHQFSQCLSEGAWLELCEKTGLSKDLHKFHEGWSAEKQNCLFVQYKQLINDQRNTINQIEDFFGLALTQEPVTLTKLRYTR
jgi:hypothetical protein